MRSPPIRTHHELERALRPRIQANDRRAARLERQMPASNGCELHFHRAAFVLQRDCRSYLVALEHPAALELDPRSQPRLVGQDEADADEHEKWGREHRQLGSSARKTHDEDESGQREQAG